MPPVNDLSLTIREINGVRELVRTGALIIESRVIIVFMNVTIKKGKLTTGREI